MKVHIRKPLKIGSTFAILFISMFSLLSQEAVCAEIPESRIKPLIAELNGLKHLKGSTVSRRRAIKGLIRKTQSIIKSQKDAPNRFRVLVVLLKSQQYLLSLENSTRNRKEFFSTCSALIKAPDEYIEYRFVAEMIFLNKSLETKDADLNERVEAFSKLVKSYRDTKGELKCILTVIKIATKMGALDLKNNLIKSLEERFPGDAKAIAFRRQLLGASRMDVVFKGNFEKNDGTKISFPMDRIGHPYLAVFWSQKSPHIKDEFKKLKEDQSKYPDRFKIYSFNLDNLPDAGESIIRSTGLKCTALRLPGGRESETYLTYALTNPYVLRVNQFGHVFLPPGKGDQKNEDEKKGGHKKFAHARAPMDNFIYPRTSITQPRYLSQIQSLFIGDFLVTGKPIDKNLKLGPNDIPFNVINKIQSSFIMAPLRYRQTVTQATDNYKRIEKLCSDAIAKFPKASNLWQVRNKRIIALLGMGAYKGESKYVTQASEESFKVLSEDLPKESELIARYCLAKDELWKEGSSSNRIISKFIDSLGSDKANALSYSAASILGIQADSREIYERYRTIVLNNYSEDESVYPIVSFFQNRYHQFYLFSGSPLYYHKSREYRFVERRYLIDNGDEAIKTPMPSLELINLDGSTFTLPKKNNNKLTVLAFVEPPPSGKLDLYEGIYTMPIKSIKKNPYFNISGLLSSANTLVTSHLNKEIDLVIAFVSDDIKHIKALHNKCKFPGKITMIPGGNSNPIVKKLGLVSADIFPNIYVIRRDNTIAWNKGGLFYPALHSFTYVYNMGIGNSLIRCEVEVGYRALENKNYKEAARIFSGAYTIGDQRLFKWTSSIYHGRALAHMGLKDWEKALEDIVKAKTDHRKYFNHNHEKPSTSMIYMELAEAKILDKLGRSSEARLARKRGSVEPTEYPTKYSRIRGYNKPYQLFDHKLGRVAKEIK